ncbi:Putative URI domain endonuclease [Ignavibacterium album JCM 16511]|uniref:Putative URI domain endonuclease n=1 Tax=Ignavibacterium album (strain DSM 19864 / JCM 16511 / NBRC 101810 / Mat9-16) TaxID=945713 RepID=I0ALP3_IGNAJ|nr:GIY-YIG nuclease family protein [Ignavibacterium album]AFH49900.1 Putative URI domain endonuclease [Ignavibacterium album JCM 16511]
MENFYTYIIESLSDQSWYIGHTNNIERRLEEHNSGENKSTRAKRPWKLIFLRKFETNLEANRFELKLKKLRNKNFIRKEYSEFFLNF